MDITPTVPDEKDPANTPDTRAAEACEQIDAILTRYQELGLFNGSALVANCGQIILKKGYGLANMEWGIPNTPTRNSGWGQSRKQFTATLVMQLVEQGTD
jgi:CubicO group peptidase (beta-lactamase class C family)